MKRARLVGINHVALEVGDLEEALAFYGRLLDFELRGRGGSRMAFIDAGDQFIALAAGRRRAPDDDGRHFGLVVDDSVAVRRALEAAAVAILPGDGLEFRDPWGNLIQVVQYDEIQFTKAPGVLEAMGLSGLSKTDAAHAELARKGVANS